MQPAKYATFCVCGAIAWIVIFVSMGHFFGNLPQVKSNFHYVIGAIIVISAVPAVIEVIKARRHAAAAQAAGKESA